MPGRSEHRAHPGLLADGNVKATFFTLGWIAERYPAMVRRIVDGGHELASHGYGHLRASDQDLAQFTDDITSSKKLLEDIGGQQVRGYRARAFLSAAPTCGRWTRCLTPATATARASTRSSTTTTACRRAALSPFIRTGNDGLLEVPITTVRMGKRNLPAGGGGYFRLLPYALSRWMMEKVNADDRNRPSSTSTRGKSTPASRARRAWT
jgi:polysaccharide deacetylase family protein (PEP-CTERM system associated)